MQKLLLPIILAFVAAGCSRPQDGSWAIVTIDGQRVPPGSFALLVRDGLVAGGRDGCNNWGFDENVPPAADGSRLIVSDAMACVETPEQRAYRSAVAAGSPILIEREDGSLHIVGGGHEMIARRAQN